jgi:hypothetical protein
MKYKIFASTPAANIELDSRNTIDDACLKALQLSSLCPDVRIQVRECVPNFGKVQLQLVATYCNSVRL